MFTKTDTKQQLIASIPLFAGADDRALEHLAATIDTVEVEAGTVLIQQGLRHNSVYVIVSGSAAVEINDVPVTIISDGQVFGEIAFFSQGPASATVTAQSKLSLLAIPFNRFDQTLFDNPAFARVLLGNLADRLRDANAAR